MMLDARVAYNIYVVDLEGKFKGTLTLREMLEADPKTLIKNIVRKDFVYAYVDDALEKVASIVIKNHVCAIPILDHNQKLLGIVSADEILNSVRIESNRCVYRLAGILGLEPMPLRIDLKSILAMVKARTPWLIVCLTIGVFVSGGIIRIFEDALAVLPVIVVFIPVLMASGGNISTQSSTILVRSLALGRVRTRLMALRFFLSELEGCAVIGSILGTFIFTLALWWIGDLMLAVTLLLTMLALSIAAAGIGFMIPYLSHAARIDPALISGPMVTLIKDVAGLLIYFLVIMTVYFPHVGM